MEASMNDNNMIFIGLDTHKDFNEIAYCKDDRSSKPIHQGRVPNTKQAATKLIRQLQSKYPHATLHFVYEAGPCGYWLYRFITSLGHCCYIVAPSLVPKSLVTKSKRISGMRLNFASYLRITI
jgi:transposase